MKHLTVTLLCALATACTQQPNATDNSLTAAPSAQCAKDTDCKGDRICETGVCQAPGGASLTAPIETQSVGLIEAAETVSTTGNPKFKDYAVEVYKGPAGQLEMSSESARTFKTRLTESMQEEPVFAGEYSLTTFGCGSSGCINQIFVSRKTGHVIEESFGSFSASGITDENDEDVRLGDTIEGMEPNSRLLVIREQTDTNEEDGKDDFVAAAKFFVLDGGKLKLIKTVPLPKPVVKSDY